MAKRKKKPVHYENMTKEAFLTTLTSLDKDQITDLILTKGKEPKMITPVMIIK